LKLKVGTALHAKTKMRTRPSRIPTTFKFLPLPRCVPLLVG
jgi:hypothetical protein